MKYSNHPNLQNTLPQNHNIFRPHPFFQYRLSQSQVQLLPDILQTPQILTALTFLPENPTTFL